jgi:exodeoxyribonuclease V beta subunit
VSFTPFDPVSIPLAGKNLVEASAGTGKTYAITTLFLRLLLELELEPSRIVVVTFTEAATLELRDRVRARLVEAEAAFREAIAGREAGDPVLARLLATRGDSLKRDAARLRRAIEDVDEAAISTIHGFCQRMLHDGALSARMEFDAELVPDLSELRDDVLYDFWQERFADAPRELCERLRETGMRPQYLRRVLNELTRHPSAAPVPEPDGTGEVRAALELVHDFARVVPERLARAKDRRAVIGFEDLLSRLAAALDGERGRALSLAMRARFGAVLVDEFQDTDPLQFHIFDSVFGDGRMPLFLIGDPKQAIYGFRGADIFTYLAAGRGARGYTMSTNYRSDAALVRAVNRVFARSRPFLIPEIEYPAVSARPEASGSFHSEYASGAAALEFLFVERHSGAPPMSKGEAEVARLTAADIAELLIRGAVIRDGKTERKVTEGNIAVLTRTNDQCVLVQEALRRHGIHSVITSDESVLESAEANDLLLALGGVLEPTRAFAVKRALATGLFGVTGDEIALLDDDPARFQARTERLRKLNELWVTRGFVRMFRALLDDAGTAEHLLSLSGGERRFTNFLHLGEILHRASTEEHLGPAALVRYLSLQMGRRNRPDDSEIRLESDDAAVRLLTVHKAKGLEFDVVYCPFTWSSRQVKNETVPRLFHDERHRTLLDVDFDKKRREPRVHAVQREGLAEELRVLYVALTRARHRTTVVWGNFKSMGRAAASYVFHPEALADAALPHAERFKEATDAQLVQELSRFAEGDGGDIAVRRISPAFRGRPLPSRFLAERAFSARAVEAPVRAWQRTDSFSALIQAKRTLTPDPSEGRDHDEEVDPGASSELPSPVLERIALDGFPRGRRVGDMFHEILEHLDFQQANQAELVTLGAEKLEALGELRDLDTPSRTRACEQLWAAVRATLDARFPPERSFSLADVPQARRISELEFRVPVASVAPSALSLSRSRLARAFRAHPSPELQQGYVEQLERLEFHPLSGYLKGYIDLVFEHEGRVYVVDYKTNHLGDHYADYEAPAMREAMAHSHYYLQYHLYALAVDRLMRQQKPGYTYEENFGGVVYLFVRGLRPAGAGDEGVFFEKPPLARMQALSAVFDGVTS